MPNCSLNKIAKYIGCEIRPVRRSVAHRAPMSTFDGVCNVLVLINVMTKKAFEIIVTKAGMTSRRIMIVVFIKTPLCFDC